MPYDPSTQPRIWLPNEYLGAEDLNRDVSDVLKYLLFERSAQQVHRTGAADYTTSANAWIDVDAANLILSVPVKSTKLVTWAHFYAFTNLSAVAGGFDITVNGTRLGGSFGIARQQVNSTHHMTIGPIFLKNVSNGTYTLKMQYRSFAANPVTVFNNGFPILFAAADGW